MAAKVDYAYFKWAGGTHLFCLTDSSGNWSQVWRRTTVEPLGPLYHRLMNYGWSTHDIRAVIHSGLLCQWPGKYDAGKAAVDALVKEFVDGRPVAESLMLAQSIVAVAMFGIDQDKADAASEPALLNEKVA